MDVIWLTLGVLNIIIPSNNPSLFSQVLDKHSSLAVILDILGADVMCAMLQGNRCCELRHMMQFVAEVENYAHNAALCLRLNSTGLSNAQDYFTYFPPQ